MAMLSEESINLGEKDPTKVMSSENENFEGTMDEVWKSIIQRRGREELWSSIVRKVGTDG
jgi:hypothetical protein